MLRRFFIFLLGLGIGCLFVYFRKKIVDTIGKTSFAERFFGSGGSYFMWQLVGIIIIVLSLLYLTGVLDRIVGRGGEAFFQPF